MNREKLIQLIRQKQSFLCIGLDTDLNKIPTFLLDYEDPIFEFNKRIIDATKDLCIAYKPNIAFYEIHGTKGWESLQKTLDYIPNDIFTIADAKRGDIGNTASMYAKTFLETYDFDSITVNPYMGRDSIQPFLNFEGKWAILLGLTSNEGASDIQLKQLDNGKQVFEEAILGSTSFGTKENMMYVVGATKSEYLKKIRTIIPDHFLLVPGLGAQGGSLDEVCEHGFNQDIGIIVNSSRAILYASSGEDFAEAARAVALSVQKEMKIVMGKWA